VGQAQRPSSRYDLQCRRVANPALVSKAVEQGRQRVGKGVVAGIGEQVAKLEGGVVIARLGEAAQPGLVFPDVAELVRTVEEDRPASLLAMERFAGRSLSSVNAPKGTRTRCVRAMVP